MATISYIRACQPSTMVNYGSDLAAQNSSFVNAVEQVDRDVDSTMNGWQGDAAAAASGRTVASKLAATNIDDVTTRLVGHYQTFGTEMDGYRTALLGIVDNEAVPRRNDSTG